MQHGQSLLEVVVAILFDKVLGEAYFSGLYSDLCVKISKEVAEMFEMPAAEQPQQQPATEDGKQQAAAAAAAQKKRSLFRTILLNECQDAFGKGLEEVSKDGKSADEVVEMEMLQKRRMLGNIRFIGELYKKAMITEKIMHACVVHLLTENEEDLEALCNLLSTIGKKLDNSKAEARMDDYFFKLESMVNGKGGKEAAGKLSSRLRFMILDLLDLRKNHWQPRVKKAEAKSKEQVRQESEAEAAAKAANTNRGGQAPRGGQTITMLPRAGGAMSMPAAGGHSKQPSAGQDIRILTNTGTSLQQTISGGKGRPALGGGAGGAASLTQGGSARSSTPGQLTPSSSATFSLRPGGSLRPQTKANIRGSDASTGSSAASSATSTPPSASPVDTSDSSSLPRSSSTSQLSSFRPVAADDYPTALDKTVESGWKEYSVGGDYGELINLVKEEAKGIEHIVMQHALNVAVNVWKHEAIVRQAAMRLYDDSHLTRDAVDRGVSRYLSLLTADFITEECPAAPKRIATILAPFIEQGKLGISAVTSSLLHLVDEGEAGPVFAALVSELVAHKLDKQSVLDLLDSESFSLASMYADEETVKGELTGKSGENLQQLFPLASFQTPLNDLLQRSFTPASAPSFVSHVDAVVSLLTPHSSASSSAAFVRSLYRSVLDAARQTDGAEVEVDKLVSTFVAPLLTRLAATAPLASFAQSADTLRAVHLSLVHASYAYGVARESTPALFAQLVGLLSRHSVLTEPASLLSEWRDAVSKQGWVAEKDREAAYEAAVAALK